MLPNGLTQEEAEQFLRVLKQRFESNPGRHAGVEWGQVEKRLRAQPEKLWALYQMEQSGGEPDAVGKGSAEGEVVFYDCSPESPAGRRNLCYDQEALENRRKNKPEHSAMAMAEEMGIKLLSEKEYRDLQELGEFDRKTSSWVRTPEKIRRLGGALFCDRRYDTVFLYHNGAESYYGSRGFRGKLGV